MFFSQLLIKTKTQKKDTEKTKEEPSSFFQRKRVDMLLGELLNKFPLPMPQNAQHPSNTAVPAAASASQAGVQSTATVNAAVSSASPNVSNGHNVGSGSITTTANNGKNDSTFGAIIYIYI